MRIAIVVLLMSAALVSTEKRADAGDEAIIRVRLYDYADISPATINDAQRLAAKFYSEIELTVDWAPTFRPHGRKNGAHDPGILQDYTINILSASMVARTHWPPDALGSAVVTPTGGGKIAYVLYDRLKAAAFASGWPVKDLLAVVIAHELGHLILGPGSHSPDGLMRGSWDVSELRRMRPDSFAFTREQLALIEERVTRVAAQ